MSGSIEKVKKFWEENPLFTGESNYPPGSIEFFEDHKEVYYNDVFAGHFDRSKYLPTDLPNGTVLDLGCGIGFWTIEILTHRKVAKMHAADLTENALNITSKRLEAYNLVATLSQQNAEKMSFDDKMFHHVNCQGVIHHTPNTVATLREIARVLKPGGTASISVYYKNWFLKNWKWFSSIGGLLTKVGGGLKGRGRESIFSENDPDEITRLYDGDENPIGKSYSRSEIIKLVSPYFKVEQTFLFFFPARSLPRAIPKFIHRFLDKQFGFMIHLNLVKK